MNYAMPQRDSAGFFRITRSDMQRNLLAVRSQMAQAAARAGRDINELCLIAVSKTRSLEEVRHALACGQKIFGENQVQDALSKISTLAYPQAEWHMIGHLQTNKVRFIPASFQWLHTLDSVRLAEKLDAAMNHAGVTQALHCLLQVNVTGEQTRAGVRLNEVDGLLQDLLSRKFSKLDFRGLMTIGVQGDGAQTRKVFSALRECRDHCRNSHGLDKFDQLSMGMSDDFEIAIEEGATMLRIGTRLFGERKKRLSK